MLNLLDQIKVSLRCDDIPLWWPTLTKRLVEVEWERLNCETGITPDSYSTARIASDNTSAQVVTLTLPLDPNKLAISVRVELPSAALMCVYGAVGVNFYTVEELTDSTVIECLEEAMHLIGYVPSLWQTVNSLVRSLHVLRPTDVEHDISFSEPHVPFSVFISVPCKRIPNDALRVAEAIVHEAMHLQLTLIEKSVQLVECTQRKYFSPWRGEYRNARGILHAVYVFRVIDCFLENLLLSHRLCGEELSYVWKRRTEIAAQVREVKSFCNWPDLTIYGLNLVRRLLN